MFNWTRIRHFKVILRKTSLNLKLKCSTVILKAHSLPSSWYNNWNQFPPPSLFYLFPFSKVWRKYFRSLTLLKPGGCLISPRSRGNRMRTAMGWLVLLQACTAPYPQDTGCRKVTVLYMPATASKPLLKCVYAVGEKREVFKHTSLKIWELKKNWVTSDCYHLAHFTPRLPRNVFHMCLWNKIVSCQKENILQLSIAFCSEQFKCNNPRRRIPPEGIMQAVRAQPLCFVCAVL